MQTTRATDFTGFGISYRPEFAEYADEIRSHIQCVEVLFDDALLESGQGSEVLAWGLPTAAHGLSFSPVRADFAIDSDVDAMFARARDSGVSLISEHLSLSRVAEFDIPNFIPASKTHREAVRVGRNIAEFADHAGLPIAMENPVTFFSHPDDEMSESAFMNEISELADCGLLLDVNNLFINSVNFKFDPHKFINSLDGDRIRYLHVAGYDEVDGLLLDSHASTVAKAVWDLTEYALNHTYASAVILERDNWSAGHDEVMSELSVLRDVWHATRG